MTFAYPHINFSHAMAAQRIGKKEKEDRTRKNWMPQEWCKFYIAKLEELHATNELRLKKSIHGLAICQKQAYKIAI